MKRVDLVIAGAGFAGLACARVAATLGLRVLVLEQKPEPGAFPRTTGILVKEAAERWAIPRRLTRKVRGVRLYSPSLSAVDIDSPAYYFLATDTPELLRWFAAQAEAAGAEIACGQAYRGAWVEAGGVRMHRPLLEARFLAGADGARSRVARDFGLGSNRRFLIGVEAEYDGVRGVDDDRLHCFLDARLAPGYIAWVVPGCGITQVGLATSASSHPRLEPFISLLAKLFDFRRARLLSRRAGLIPVGGPVRPFAGERVLLIGDAAGLVSPLTAGGIHTALQSGERAGHAIADHLLDGGPEPSLALRGLAPGGPWKRLLRRLFDLPPPNWLVDLAFASGILRVLARALFFHQRLFSPPAGRDERLPFHRERNSFLRAGHS